MKWSALAPNGAHPDLHALRCTICCRAQSRLL